MAAVHMNVVPRPQILSLETNQLERIKHFRRQWENYCVLTGYNTESNDVRMRLLHLMMGFDTCWVIDNVLSEEDRTTPESLLRALENYYSYAPVNHNVKYHRYYLNTLIQSPEESIDEFANRIRLLAARCAYKDDQIHDVMLDRFIAGLNNDNLRNNLLALPSITFADACEYCRKSNPGREHYYSSVPERIMVNEGNYPVNGGNFPVSGSNYPVNGGNFPVSGSNYPVNGDNFPVSGGNFPQFSVSICSTPLDNENLMKEQVEFETFEKPLPPLQCIKEEKYDIPPPHSTKSSINCHRALSVELPLPRIDVKPQPQELNLKVEKDPFAGIESMENGVTSLPEMPQLAHSTASSENGVSSMPPLARKTDSPVSSTLSTPHETNDVADSTPKPPIETFEVGSFVVAKSDVQARKGDRPIWKIDSTSLLQKFLPVMDNGVKLYKSSAVYSGWSSSAQEQYEKVEVSTQTRNFGSNPKEIMVQLTDDIFRNKSRKRKLKVKSSDSHTIFSGSVENVNSSN